MSPQLMPWQGALVAQAVTTADVTMDFNYADTTAMLADSTYWQLVEDNFAAGTCTLDTTDAASPSVTGKCMKYTWTAFGSPGAGGTMSRRLLITGTRRRVWTQFYMKFSADWRIDNGFSGGVAYKQSAYKPTGPAGRFGLEPGNGENGIWGFYTDNSDFVESSDPTHMSTMEDGNWHFYRHEVDLDHGGIVRMSIDGGTVRTLTGFASTATGLEAYIIGENINQRPLVAQVNKTSYVQIWWTQSPGWAGFD